MQEVVWFPFYLKKGFVLWIDEMEKKMKEKFSRQNIETRKLNSTTEKRICARDSSSSTNKVDSVQQTRTGNILAVYFLKILGERGAFAPDKICLAFLNGTPNLDF